MRHFLKLALVMALFCAPWEARAQTAQTKQLIQSEISSKIPDQAMGQVTPAIMRGVLNDMVASWQQFTSVNPQNGTFYVVLNSDYGKLVTFNNSSAVAVTLPQAAGAFSTFNFYGSNLGNGIVTITPQGGSLINGGPSLSLSFGQSVQIVSDGSNYQIFGQLARLGITGTTGGIPFFSSPSTIASTNALPTCANALTFNSTTLNWGCNTGAGTGNVVGPVSAVVGDLACWNNIAGSALLDCGGAVRTASGSTSIASTDCNGAVIENGAFQTITLPATTGFPANCVVRIANANASRAQKLSGFPSSSLTGCGSICLYPNNDAIVAISAGSWVWVKTPDRGKFSSLTLYVGTVAAGCSNNNDGLASSAPLCSIQTASNLSRTNFDNLNSNPIIQLLDGNYTECVTIAGQGAGHINDGVNIQGDAGATGAVAWTACANGNALHAPDYGLVFLQNLALTCNGAPLLFVRDAGNIDINTGVTLTCTGQHIFDVQFGGRVNIDASMTIAGNPDVVFFTFGAGANLRTAGGITITCQNSLAIGTAFAEAADLSEIYLAPTAPVFSGCGAVTGKRFLISNALINTGTANTNYFPGTINGTGSVGAFGQYQ